MTQQAIAVGDKVKVMRRNGKHGVPFEDTGVVERESKTIQIQGEPTVVVRYDSDGDYYWHRIAALTKIEQL
jgi:hypothetical protein